MPATDHEGSTTAAATLPSPPTDRPAAPALDHHGVDHWQRRLDRARATVHLHKQDG
jgi:hypothetical protein